MVGFLRKLLGEEGSGVPDPGGRLGDDILDLSPFGGSWENIVRRMHTKRSHADKALEYITTGSMTGVPTWQNQWADVRAYHEATGSVVAPARLRAALMAALPSNDLRDRASHLYLHNAFNWNRSPANALRALAGNHSDSERLTVRDVESIGTRLGWPPHLLIEQILDPRTYMPLNCVADLDQLFERDADLVRRELAVATKDTVNLWGRVRAHVSQPHELFGTELCRAATANTASLRSAVRPLFEDMPTVQKIAGLREVLADAKPAQRGRIVETAANLDPSSEREEFIAELRRALAKDRSAAVKDALLALDAAPDDARVPPPPLPTLSEVAKVEFPRKVTYGLPDRQQSWFLSSLERMNEPSLNPHGQASVWALDELLGTDAPAVASMSPAHVVRMLYGRSGTYVRATLRSCLTRLHGSQLRPSPIDVLATTRFDELSDDIAVRICANVVGAMPNFWSAEEITAWSEYVLSPLLFPLDTKSDYALDRAGYFALLGKVQPQPVKLRDALLKAAVAGYKTDRSMLQRAVDLESVEPVLKYLTSRKKGERVGAAELLRARPLVDAKKPLLTAARKENDDSTMVALLAALQANDVPIDEFTSKDAVLAQAQKAVGKSNAIPKAIQWLDVESLPSVRWEDDNNVDPAIMQWFISAAVRSKSAAPSPLMVDHFGRMNRQDLKTFGATLLHLWLARDTATYSPGEAREMAVAQVSQNYARVQQYSWHQWYGLTQEQAIEQTTTELTKTHIGSESASKGVLGVVAASASGDVADGVGTYIRKHRGRRATQVKALIQMLAWIDHPAAVQLVMSIAARFRPKGIQQEAENQAQLLAKRRGWTMDDLADRSIPDGGFEANGRRVFDFGARTFTANLADDLTITLTNDETGKTVRSLPKGRADEDAEVIGEHKKDLTAAKKDLKSVVKLQPSRLHLAMCGQRSWSADDFTRYFVEHPVMARLASRLVWASIVGDEEPLGFRPLTDGTLLTADDDEFTPPEDAQIRIAHEHLLTGQGEVWAQHLADYEVSPLFAQFNRPTVAVKSGQKVIGDFEGFMHNDGSLRGATNKHNWQLGDPQDGGWVQDILKVVPTLEMTAVVELHNGLPVGGWNIGEHKLAIGDLYFVDHSTRWRNKQSALDLSTVPPILLSEVYAELQSMANAGDGHDPDYKKKVS